MSQLSMLVVLKVITLLVWLCVYQSVNIFAFDVDEAARQQCGKMATRNGVSSRVLVKAACTPSQLVELANGMVGLVVCDCEGYERELFTPEAVVALRDCDLIIETHDYLDPQISTQICDRFNGSHDVTSVFSKSDTQKAREAQWGDLAALSLAERRLLLSERRP